MRNYKTVFLIAVCCVEVAESEEVFGATAAATTSDEWFFNIYYNEDVLEFDSDNCLRYFQGCEHVGVTPPGGVAWRSIYDRWRHWWHYPCVYYTEQALQSLTNDSFVYERLYCQGNLYYWQDDYWWVHIEGKTQPIIQEEWKTGMESFLRKHDHEGLSFKKHSVVSWKVL